MRLLQMLLDKYKEEYELNLREGLIKTTERKKSIAIIKRAFPKWEVEEYFDYGGGVERNAFMVNSDFFKSTTSAKQEVDKFLKLLNNLGWFVSFLRSWDKEGNNMYYGKYDEEALDNLVNNPDLGSIRFDAEAKYDTIVEKIPKTLYHVTPKAAWDKISKVGLVPRTRTKKSYHPERVYLSTTKKATETLAAMFKTVTGIREWVLLAVDTKMIPGDYLKLYKDDNYSPYGVYTMNNIPPAALKKIGELNF